MNRTTAVMLVSLLVLATPGVVRPAEPAEGARPAAGAEPGAERGAAPVEDRAAREKWFAELLTNADLVGSFTTDGKEQAPREDRYTILKAVKGEGDNWVITAKIGYKGIALPVDITVPVKWAGDTPMIYMTNQKVAGMGAFTVRLMFYGKHYAGTWSATDHGGLMWGRIERAGAGAKPATKPTTRPTR